MILNISGRTDIVNYYTKWLLKRFEEGFVYSRNPVYPKKIHRISLTPTDVDFIIFCSKNYEPILDYIKDFDEKYRIMCQYTITPYGADIEPNVPSIVKSIDTLIRLSKIIGKEKMVLRFDPLIICDDYQIERITKTFEYIIEKTHSYISFCVTSFVVLYKKVLRNFKNIREITKEERLLLCKELGAIANKYDVTLQLCADKDDYSSYGIAKGACVTQELLEKTFGVSIESAKKGKFREECGCLTMHNLGDYNTCLNQCLYCYANQTPLLPKQIIKQHHPDSPLLIGEVMDDDEIVDMKDEMIVKRKERDLFDLWEEQ